MNALYKNLKHLLLPVALILLSHITEAQDYTKIHPALSQMLANNAAGKSTPVVQPANSIFNLQPVNTEAMATARATPMYACIVYTTKGKALRDHGYNIKGISDKLAVAFVTLDEMIRLSYEPDVTYIDADMFAKPDNAIARAQSGIDLLQQGALNNTKYTGKGVIIGIIDSGIDIKHLDFRMPGADSTKSRILYLWDQLLSPAAGEIAEPSAKTGVLYSNSDINQDLTATPAGKVRSFDTNGHGTHVAGTAAGNGEANPSKMHKGMAPEADIVIVKSGNGSFSNTNIINALKFIDSIGRVLNKPVVINLSLGGLSYAQDGYAPHEQVIDQITNATPGRVVAVAAGNNGGEKLHQKFTIPANSSFDVTFRVATPVADYASGQSLFMSFFASQQTTIGGELIAPDGSRVANNAPGSPQSTDIQSNAYRLTVYNYTYQSSVPLSGLQFVINKNNTNAIAAQTGTWIFRITNNSSQPQTVHGWNVSQANTFSAAELINGDNEYVVGSPGTAANAITVANYVGRNRWLNEVSTPIGTWGGTVYNEGRISLSSSAGPRRDDILKPEIAAVGTNVISARSRSLTYTTASDPEIVDYYYRAIAGTSMASPVVAGAAALLLQAKPTAPFNEIKNAITSQADKDIYTTNTTNTTWGYGKLNALKALAALTGCNTNSIDIIKYDDQPLPANYSLYNIGSALLAMKYTAPKKGIVGGVYFFAGNITPTDNFQLQIQKANGAGTPDGVVLASLDVTGNMYQRFSNNYFDFSKFKVPVNSGDNFFVVLKRLTTNANTFSIFAEATDLDNRGYASNNNGASYSVITNADLKIRAAVYSLQQNDAILATTTSAKSQVVDALPQFYNAACELITQVMATGSKPVKGTVNARVILNTTANAPFVKRIYEVLNQDNDAQATGKITLYYTQADFNALNASLATPLVPTGPADIQKFTNLQLSKYTGISNDGTGNPASYTGTPALINLQPANAVWNAEKSRWEITVDVTGFGSFIIEAAKNAPIVLDYFNGTIVDKNNVLNWKLTCGALQAIKFYIYHSRNGVDYTVKDSISVVANNCAAVQSYTHVAPMGGMNHYKISFVNQRNEVVTSAVVTLTNESTEMLVTPTLLTSSQNLQVYNIEETAKTYFLLYDNSGRKVYEQVLTPGQQAVNYRPTATGIYFYSISTDKKVLKSGRILVQ
jgi:minor extracellular serine protease Vpr